MLFFLKIQFEKQIDSILAVFHISVFRNLTPVVNYRYASILMKNPDATQGEFIEWVLTIPDNSNVTIACACRAVDIVEKYDGC